MLIYYASGVGLGVHHKVIWGSMLIGGLLPVWGALSPDDKSFVGLLVIGVAYIVSGVFDHRVFVRTFGSARGLNFESSHVGP